jgi:hypothetical protein
MFLLWILMERLRQGCSAEAVGWAVNDTANMILHPLVSFQSYHNTGPTVKGSWSMDYLNEDITPCAIFHSRKLNFYC